MKIKKAKIDRAFEYLSRTERLCVEIRLRWDIFKHFDVCFVLENNADVKRLQKIMAYTESEMIRDLVNTSVRIIEDGCCLRGVGDSIEDKFISLRGQNIEEYTESEFVEKFESFYEVRSPYKDTLQ